MTIAVAGQWLLLGGYTALMAWSLLVGWRIPKLRPSAAVAGTLAFSHIVYYVLFLILPDVLDAGGTMLFSIAIRFQVLFTAALLLALAVRRNQWRRG